MKSNTRDLSECLQFTEVRSIPVSSRKDKFRYGILPNLAQYRPVVFREDDLVKSVD